MGYAGRRETFIETGFNDRSHHAMLIKELEIAIPLAARARVTNLIAMFGNRDPGIDEPAAIANCIEGLSKVAPLAAEYGVTICVELLNSKIDHPRYQGDHTAFGVAVMQGVDSAHVKLLYDIYHMQIMEGDVIRTIKTYSEYIGHYHTAGNPGRHDMDETQELYYPAIMRAIAETGYTGFVGHEFSPKGDPIEALKAAYATCNI